jgi:hypothetical protein
LANNTEAIFMTHMEVLRSKTASPGAKVSRHWTLISLPSTGTGPWDRLCRLNARNIAHFQHSGVADLGDFQGHIISLNLAQQSWNQFSSGFLRAICLETDMQGPSLCTGALTTGRATILERA